MIKTVSVFVIFVIAVVGLDGCSKHSKKSTADNRAPNSSVVASSTNDHSQEGPSLDVVGQACRKMAAATPIHYHWGVGSGDPQLYFMSADILGTSIEQSSNTAIVKASCRLMYQGLSNVTITYTNGGGGFVRWLPWGKNWQYGETVDYAVTFHFRRFDTGWEVEGND